MIDYVYFILHLKHEPSKAELLILNDRIDAWCEEFCLEPYSVDMTVGGSEDEDKS